jgi:hypothetical protein
MGLNLVTDSPLKTATMNTKKSESILFPDVLLKKSNTVLAV